MENIHKIPAEEIQCTINDQLFLDSFVMEISDKSISYRSHRKTESEYKEIELLKYKRLGSKPFRFLY